MYIHACVSVEVESSVAFLDTEHDDPDLPLYRTKLYMAGKVFAMSTLDALLSCVGVCLNEVLYC